MNCKRLLERGYFPKELPPPFETGVFAKHYARILARAGRYSASPKESKTMPFSVSKGKLSRRKLEIPNPKQFLVLCDNLVNNWLELIRIFNLSSYSESKPTQSRAKRAVRTKSVSLNTFRLGLLNKSFNKSFELKFDISQFYPTIYTHSVTWAMMGRNDAKEYFRKKSRNRNGWPALVASDPKAKLFQMSDELDTTIRSCQERQSVGIPIGPDTSFLIAELVACRIDNEISQVVGKNAIAVRYFDDYYFYLESRAEAENVLRTCQKIINDYKLEINDRKVSIIERPFSFEYEWATNLSGFRFKNIDNFELRTFFDSVNRQISKFTADSSQIVHYAMQRFEFGHVPIKRSSWDTFLHLSLNLQLHDPSNLDQFLKVLLSYHNYWDRSSKKIVGEAMDSIIDWHINLNHSFEVSWALWILISMKVKCKHTILNKVLSSHDGVSKLICLDMIERKLFSGRRPKTSHIFKAFTTDDLYGDNWLFIYESIIKEWLSRSNKAFLDSDPFFKLIKSYNVEFYCRSNQITTEFVAAPTGTPPKKTKKTPSFPGSSKY